MIHVDATTTQRRSPGAQADTFAVSDVLAIGPVQLFEHAADFILDIVAGPHNQGALRAPVRAAGGGDSLSGASSDVTERFQAPFPVRH